MNSWPLYEISTSQDETGRLHTTVRLMPLGDHEAADDMRAVHNAFRREYGAYEVRIGSNGERLTSGDCRGCCGRVEEGDAHVVRFHDSLPGGIFHARCEPKAEGWYPVDGEAPDV